MENTDIPEEEFGDPDFEGEYYATKEKYDFSFPQFLSDSFIILLAAFFERKLIEYCNIIAKKENTKLRFSELKGNYLTQFRLFTSKVVDIGLDFRSEQWNNINRFIELRNTIVHNSSRLDVSLRSNKKRELNKNYLTLNILGQRGHPMIPFCTQMIQLVNDFLGYIVVQAKSKYNKS